MNTMRKQEDHHHAPPQVAFYVEQAKLLRDECGLSEAEWLALAPTLVTLLSAKQVFYEQVSALPNMAIPRNRG
jgi:hypothetical protein